MTARVLSVLFKELPSQKKVLGSADAPKTAVIKESLHCVRDVNSGATVQLERAGDVHNDARATPVRVSVAFASVGVEHHAGAPVAQVGVDTSTKASEALMTRKAGVAEADTVAVMVDEDDKVGVAVADAVADPLKLSDGEREVENDTV